MNTTTIFKPREYQETAINNVLKGFETTDRGKIIMPCATGKSWTYLWIKEAILSRRTIVFVPSLTLIKQIKNDWLQQRQIDFQYICVCSDSSVDEDSDANDDIEGNVTTDIEELNRFRVKNIRNNTVIFSTYHSANLIADSIREIGFGFDLMICDEAHRTAGIDKAFGIVHDNKLIPAKKRLYGTATPRILGAKVQKSDERHYYDMNDINIYGNNFYNLSYREAIKKNIICDYKIVIVGVTDNDIKNMIEEDNMDITNAVNSFAIKQCINNYNLNRIISFHNRINTASDFANKLNENHENALHINGSMSGTEKEQILRTFELTPRTIITNARCLTEGVNIPSVDAIFFADARNSIIDIIQATGRTLRKSENKEFGYIIVPIYNATSAENVDAAIKDNKLNFLIDIVKSLCLQDEALQDLINDAVRNKSETKKREIENLINENFIFKNIDIQISSKIFDFILKKNVLSYSFDVYRSYLEEHGKHPKRGSVMYTWYSHQKFIKHPCVPEIEIKYPSIIENKWNKNYSEYLDHLSKHDKHPTKASNQKLYSWYNKQKLKNHPITQEIELKYPFPIRISRMNEYLEYVEKHGHQPIFGTGLYTWYVYVKSQKHRIIEEGNRIINDKLNKDEK